MVVRPAKLPVEQSCACESQGSMARGKRKRVRPIRADFLSGLFQAQHHYAHDAVSHQGYPQPGRGAVNDPLHQPDLNLPKPPWPILQKIVGMGTEMQFILKLTPDVKAVEMTVRVIG